MAMIRIRLIFTLPLIFHFNLLSSWPARTVANEDEGETNIEIMYLDILEAKVPGQDGYVSASDTYVKINLRCTKTGTIRKVGETRIVNDSNDPVFNQTFKAEKVDFDSLLILDLLDRDAFQDDPITTITVDLKQVLLSGKNYKDLKLVFPNEEHYYLIIKLLMIGA